MSDVYKELSAKDLFVRGLRAMKLKDESTYKACLRALERRKSRIARELADELAEEGGIGNRGGATHVHAGGTFPVELADMRDVVLVTDRSIIQHRDRMLARATSRIWLSTFNLRDEDGALRKRLMEKARQNVEVCVVVSVGQAKRERAERWLAALRQAGPRVHLYTHASSHSKCVIVDEQDVLIGSANLNCTHRDACLSIRSSHLAKRLQDYLRRLTLAEREHPDRRA